ncbi:MAG TPA: SMI1/KNR4 family protein, partial [Ilumatobacter sp.]|nr:SMI1/KNR4 family protein [Ilumatobacter sp.]
RPGENLAGATAVRLDGGAVSSPLNKSNGRRCYTRGTADFEAARTNGLIDPLPPLVPATRAAIAAAESEIGHPLPSLLRRLYLEVGNGGFGPGGGVLGVADGYTDDLKQNAVEAHSYFRSSRLEPPLLVPLCHWGCGIYSLVEVAPNAGWMWGFDPNGGQLEHALYRHELDLARWLERWLDGDLYQPAVIRDPESGEWRGVTDEESVAWAAEYG